MDSKRLSLKDFIKRTLVDINDAVYEAKDDGVSKTHSDYASSTLPVSQDVEFDLSVSTENTTSKDGSVGLVISVINGSIGKKKDTSELSTNRIKFTVSAFLGKDKTKE